jgi:hypothetical protein
MTEKKETVRLLMKRDRMLREQAEEFLSYNEYRRQGGGKKGAKMAKKTVTVDIAILNNTKVRGALLAVAFAVVALVASSLGDSSGYSKGLAQGLEDGNKAGFSRGDKVGFENGYWIGREEGCLWLINESGREYVIGIGNPNAGWLFQNLGSTYFGKINCSTEGHGDAPYKPSTYVPNSTGTN